MMFRGNADEQTMPEPLDIHPASEAERVEAFRNVHDVWSGGLSPEEHLRRRLASTQHNRAEWFVGCVNGRVATSLGVYSLQFQLRDEIVSGIAIGAVHTHADFRGRGFAPQLMDWVERLVQQDRDAVISMLYSDIKPSYYARMGYRKCPSWEADFAVAQDDPESQFGEPAEWEPVPLGEGRDVAAELYRDGHASVPFSIHRSGEYWDYLTRKTPRDELCLLGRRNHAWGYVRVGVQQKAIKLRDVWLADDDPQRWQTVLATLADIARSHDLTRITGWLPECVDRLSDGILRPRSEEITMFKPLREDIVIDDAVLAAGDFFHEIDHV